VKLCGDEGKNQNKLPDKQVIRGWNCSYFALDNTNRARNVCEGTTWDDLQRVTPHAYQPNSELITAISELYPANIRALMTIFYVIPRPTHYTVYVNTTLFTLYTALPEDDLFKSRIM